MYKKLFLIISSLILAGAGGNLFAADYIWNNLAGDNLWTTAGNWDAGAVPTADAADKAKIQAMTPNDAQIRDGMAVSCNWLVVGDNASGDLHMTGGTFDIFSPAATDSWTIIAYAPNVDGTFTIDGGTVTTGDRFYVGFQGNGTLNMNGGTLTIGKTFGIGYGEGFTTGTGTVNLDGGTISVQPATTASLRMAEPAGMQAHLNITNGTLILKGDCTTVVQGFVASGYITAFNGMGDVIVHFDGTNTTVTAQINPYKAKIPYPSGTAKDVAPYTVMTWLSGDTAITHDVYFGTDSASVSAATPSTPDIYKGSQLRVNNTYTPASLEFGKQYFWRVDEVDDVNTYKGDVWSFTVATYALIDDFEAYADANGLLGKWSNGSTASTLSFAPTGGHEKAKAMQLDYNNVNLPLYSEAQTGGPTVNWTGNGIVAIDIWYKGNTSNAAEPMYAALEDNDAHPAAVVVNSNAAAAQNPDWAVWRIKLSDFAGVNLANIKKLYIGFGSRTNPAAGGAGTVLIDDIKLYPVRCLTPPVEDLNGDCRVDFEDFAIQAGNWMVTSQI